MALGLIGAGHVLEGGRMGSLAQFAAALIVFGGTLGAVLISFSFADLRQAIGALRHMFIDQAKNPEDVIAAIGRFAVKARKEGIMKLEDDVEQTDDRSCSGDCRWPSMARRRRRSGRCSKARA